MIEKISVSSGPWRVNVQSGCNEIVREDGTINGTVIGMAHELYDAVLMSCAKEMFDALVDVHGILMDVADNEVKDSIEARIAFVFERIAVEADV